MTTQHLYLSPGNFDDARAHLLACAAIPVEIGDRELCEIEELDAQIVADLLDLDGVLPGLAEFDPVLDVDCSGRIWVEVYEDDGQGGCNARRIQVLPQPVPGSWYDPAIDPSNAPAVAPEDSQGVVVVLGQEDTALLRGWLAAQLDGLGRAGLPRMAEALAELHRQLSPR